MGPRSAWPLPDFQPVTACGAVSCQAERAILRQATGAITIGEEIYIVGRKLFYKKTGRPVDEDVTEDDQAPDRTEAHD